MLQKRLKNGVLLWISPSIADAVVLAAAAKINLDAGSVESETDLT